MNAPSGRRFFVTGTDTDVGKTRVTAALARAASGAGKTTVVKMVQTGMRAGIAGDAEVAAELAGCAHRELARFAGAADPWAAALAAELRPLSAAELTARLADCEGTLAIEGSGGAAVPLNAFETLTDVARSAQCQAVLVVGMRLGCINHALLSTAYLHAHGVRVAGAVLCERWSATTAPYRNDVLRALERHVDVIGILRHEPDARRSVQNAAALFAAWFAPVEPGA